MFWLLVRVNTVVPEAPGSSSELSRYKANQNPEDEFQRNRVLHLKPLANYAMQRVPQGREHSVRMWCRAPFRWASFCPSFRARAQ